MKQNKSGMILLASSVAFLILIIDSKTSLNAAKEGIALCVHTVIPSLFPFFVISSLLNASLQGRTYKMLSGISCICRIPQGTESIFFIGLTGGYPVGALSVKQAYESKAIVKNEAERMLGFCNNPGPAFLFGITGAMFQSVWIPFLLYCIVISSAIITGRILPGGSNRICSIPKHSATSPLKQSIQAMAQVCAWVVLFRVLLAFLDKWIFRLFPDWLVTILSGMLELTNGCLSMNRLENEALQFIIAAFLMTFGGLCVGMQTISVAGNLSCKYYYIGKTIQCVTAVSLAIPVSIFLFPGNIPYPYMLMAVIPAFGILAGKLTRNTTGNYLAHGV